ncbi:hypothetical protein CHLNCDRAFT_143843 [Chlorella variabilis]|uniref:Rab3-GAP regulatory subunit N-terminal domain-containing protein n=1 Tax=Chlorella variabilis TaxID=554065 RepID=E1ZAK2_CHLVA|nr:hypothetical protein CHLNCDRAFT_143843 [Chlorella variabilis]EFN57078.1 hypothetical protein CHLNCDRAFT_143843 [Chlorella variabilis]|eukprot:XP_005849180.1 hypothetical protein CHLNCDRAFT_143843 [Chlorella variabilis]
MGVHVRERACGSDATGAPPEAAAAAAAAARAAPRLPPPAAMLELAFLPKLLLQHDSSPMEVLEDVQSAFLAAARRHAVQAALSPSGDGLAVALGQRLVVLNLFNLGSAASNGGNAAVEFVSAVDAPETVTALAWLAAGAQSADECILVGTSEGFLQLHSAASGALLLRQALHHSAAVAAAVRCGGCGTDPSDLSEDVTLAFGDAVVRLPAWEVWAAVRWHTGRGGGGGWWGGGGGGGPAPHQLSFSKFTLPRGAGPRSQAVCLGPPPLSLQAAMKGRQDQHRRLHILTAGSAPPLAAYEAEECAAPGLLSLVSDLASSTAASLLGRIVPRPAASAGRSLLGGLRRGSRGGSAAGGEDCGDGRGGGGDAQQQQQQRREKVAGEPASLVATVWDEKRCITQMALSPTGGWAACCDSLGRVMLVDTAATLVVRMLKGYREAQVAWLVCGSGSRGGGGAGASVGNGLAPLGGSSSSLASLGSSVAGSSVADLASPPRLPRQRQEERRRQEEEQQEVQQQQQHQHHQQQLEPGDEPEAPAAGSGSPQPQPQQQAQAQAAAQPFPDAAAGQRFPRGGHLLVVYAPRRGVVELWEPQSLTRVGSVRCPAQLGLLLQQPTRRDSGPGSAAGPAAPFPPNRCLLLDAAALTLHDLTGPLADLL